MDNTNLQLNEPVLRKPKKAADYYAMFLKARDFDQQRFYDYQENMAFFEGKQQILSAYAGDKPWVVDITTPYATDAISLRTASLISKDYVGELEPLSQDDEDDIEKLDMAYKTQWKRLNMDNQISESIQRCAVLREAYTHIVYNPDSIYGGTNAKQKGQLEAYFIDPAAVFIDPNAITLKEADYVIITERISPKKVMEQYSQYDFELTKGSTIYSPQDRGELYVGNEYSAEQENILTKLVIYEMENQGTRKQAVYRTVLIEDQIVEPTEKMKIRFLPIAQLRWEKRMKSPYGISLMDRLISNQKLVNAIESAIGNTALSFAAPSYLLSKDSGLDPEEVAVTAGAPGMVYTVDGNIDAAMRPLMQGRIVDDQMIQIKMNNEQTIYKIAGVTSPFMGSIGTAGNTATGIEDVMQRATMIEQKFLQNLEEYIEDLTHIVVDFMVKVFKNQMFYVRGEKQANGQFPFERIEIPPNAENLSYTFAVDMVTRTPLNVEKNKKTLMELFQFERQYDAPVKIINEKDILKAMDIPNRNELIVRYDETVSRDIKSQGDLIAELSTVAATNGINPEMLSMAIQEIIIGKETPTVDQILKQVEEAKKAQEQQEMAQQQMPQASGDETFGGPDDGQQMPQGQQLPQQQMQPQQQMTTGDETFD